ncbi:MAG: SDR family oxidoreductase [Gammaproteobacteria bacterium]|nr:SDR family oxidoreductase [Gammaproteobacteria bacterium]
MNIAITAGASGIGLAMTEAFLANGDAVAICDIDQQAIERFKSKYPETLALCASVNNEAEIAQFITQTQLHLGCIDVLCANAGTGGPASAIEDIELKEWKDCISVNLDGAFLSAKHTIPGMKRQQAGLILFTSSTAGLYGYPYRSPYACAKWAIIGLTKTLAIELGGSGIRVNVLCPGSVNGDRMDRVIANEAKAKKINEQEVRENYVKGVSMKTWVDASDIADMAVFLASDKAAKVSGQVISIDGNTETLNA